MDGITGVYGLGDKELVQTNFLVTGMVQHRGKASAGIAVGNGKGIYIHKGLGRIGDVINPEIMQAYQDLEPVAAIGNVGYTKNKIPEERNAEPIRICPKSNSSFEVVLTMDGYLVMEDDIKAELEADYDFETGNKTEVVGALLRKYISENGKVTFEAGKRLVDKLHGRATFALSALVYDGRETRLVTLNDDKAFEPLCYGKVGENFVVSSESCSHKRLGTRIEREYDGAEMTICSFSNGPETRRLREEEPMPDIFQGVYFGNVASMFRGKENLQIRRALGLELVDLYGDPGADIVIPNPESGWGVSVGIADGLKKPLRPALIKLAQAVRTFQESERRKRTMEVGLKFSGIDSLLRDQKIVMGDDSVVKGSVGEGGSIWVVYNSGAKDLEFWISYAPMVFPSFKGWHNGRECLEELAVHRAFNGDSPYGRTTEEINEAVANLFITRLKNVEDRDYNLKVKFNLQERIEKVTGPGSFQALDASYPIDEEFWPDWLKDEVDKFHKHK